MVGTIPVSFRTLRQVVEFLASEPLAGQGSQVRHEQVRVCQSIRPWARERLWGAQFHGYRDAGGAASDSTVAAFAAIQRSIGDPTLESSIPVYPYERGPRGLAEADRIVACHGAGHHAMAVIEVIR